MNSSAESSAATAAPSGSFSPIRRATIAVVERLSPSPMANTRLNSDSVSPTVAIASAPSRPTQNTSTTANNDSSTISSTIGIARSKIARFRLPVVKSWCDPRRASRIDFHIDGGVTLAFNGSIKTFAFCTSALPSSKQRAALFGHHCG